MCAEEIMMEGSTVKVAEFDSANSLQEFQVC